MIVLYFCKKPKKKRAEKYEPKVKFEGSFKDILNLLPRIRKLYGSGKMGTIRNARIQAVKDFANERQVTERTISSKFYRELEPDIKGTAAFDIAVKDWLDKKTDTLKKALLNRTNDINLKKVINDSFDKDFK